MKPLPHRYQVTLTAARDGYASLQTAGLPALAVASPREFDGPGDAWSPEHLLLAAVEGCYLLTFRAVAKVSQLPFVSLDVEAVGTVDRVDRVTRFTGIVLRPRLTIAAGTNRERALQVLAKAESACLVSASLSTPIRLEPHIVENAEAEAMATPIAS